VRVALHIVKQRRKRLRSLFRAEGFLPLAAVCRHLGVSEATARRDLAAVAAKGHITRTRGGGLINQNSPSLMRGLGAINENWSAGAKLSGSSSTALRITLRDIAEKTGFAKTTVSLSLRNNPKIPEATRRIVRTAAKELGYRPDPALARIAEHRWRTKSTDSGSTVAFGTTLQTDGDESLDAQAMSGARARALDLGYGFEHFRLESYSNAARLGSVLFHRGIRGVIVGQVAQADFCVRFPWERFSSIDCNAGHHRPPINVVVPDNAHALMLAWRQAVANGFAHIGVALTEELHPMGEVDRTCAALYCQSYLPSGTTKVPILHVQPDDRASFLGWVKQHGPDMILGSNDIFFRWLDEAGYRVPRDFGFASLAVHPSAGSGPKITGMDCNMEMIGQAAVEQLDILIRTNQIGIPVRPFALMVESNWVTGETLGNLTKQGSRQDVSP
jgi:LacI family transcriptional regulator